MSTTYSLLIANLLALFLSCTALPLAAQTANPIPGPPQQRAQMNEAKGTFQVKLAPQTDAGADAKLARMTIAKQFSGDLDGTSMGQMLSAMTDTKGSAGYVAIEKVTGKLGGHAGTFVLQHSATMDRGTPHLLIAVVPDSGTGELTGLSGTMEIVIAEGKHSYVFHYSLTH